MSSDLISHARRLVGDELAASDVALSETVTMPPVVYTDDDFFAFEKEVIFMKEWICVGRQEQIPQQGDYLTFTIAEEPIVIVRGGDGTIRAMSAVCQHRSMIVTDPPTLDEGEWHAPSPNTAGNCGYQLRCPYHFWVYDLTGQLVGAPEMSRTANFDRREIRLPTLKVELWQGFIFVNFDLDAAPLAPRMAQAEEYLANWHMEDLVLTNQGRVDDLDWNWKVMHENFIEIYHVDRLHLPIHEMIPASKMVLTPFDDDSAMVMSRAHTTRPDYSFNATMGAVLPVIETLTDDDKGIAYFGIAPPTLGIGTSADSLIYVLIIPKSANKMDLIYATLFPRKTTKLRHFKDLEEVASGGLYALTKQDVAALKSVQRGLRSRFAPRGRLSWQEEPINHFNRWLIKRYRQAFDDVTVH